MRSKFLHSDELMDKYIVKRTCLPSGVLDAA